MSRQPLSPAGFLGYAALVGAAALGVLVATGVPGAAADTGLPVPTVPVPTLPATPSVPLPTDSGGAAGDGSSNTSGSGGSTTRADSSTATAGSGVRSPAAVEGAIVLTGGAVSIPVTSVQAPARLVIDWVSLSPTAIRAAGQPVRAAFRVSDSRGYVVRDAVLDVRSLPAGRIGTAVIRPTGVDGVVRFWLRPTKLLSIRRGTRLTILVRAYQPAGKPSGGIAALRIVSLPISPR
ncbi:MAG TPA: hypothetical protein VGJ25_03190 [Gaiellaceae bacterium]|jgi:hypothetical protein